MPAPPEPPAAAPELETLSAFLDLQRAIVLDKARGLTPDQLCQTLGPSTLTLGGLVHHLALVEDYWFNDRFLGNDPLEPWASVDWEADSDWDFSVAATLDFAVIQQRYLDACERSRQAVEAAESVDQHGVKGRRSGPLSLRWILVHMIEETARHAGHADLIRESIDGETGNFRDD